MCLDGPRLQPESKALNIVLPATDTANMCRFFVRRNPFLQQLLRGYLLAALILLIDPTHAHASKKVKANSKSSCISALNSGEESKITESCVAYEHRTAGINKPFIRDVARNEIYYTHFCNQKKDLVACLELFSVWHLTNTTGDATFELGARMCEEYEFSPPAKGFICLQTATTVGDLKNHPDRFTKTKDLLRIGCQARSEKSCFVLGAFLSADDKSDEEGPKLVLPFCQRPPKDLDKAALATGCGAAGERFYSMKRLGSAITALKVACDYSDHKVCLQDNGCRQPMLNYCVTLAAVLEETGEGLAGKRLMSRACSRGSDLACFVMKKLNMKKLNEE